MATEWEHQNMRMTINDYIEHIHDIENVKVKIILELWNYFPSLFSSMVTLMCSNSKYYTNDVFIIENSSYSYSE